MSEKTTQHPMVSVVMPAYKQAEYIGFSINSVLDQTFKNIELIIIDNYSEDGTSGIIEEYARKDHRIRHQKFQNHGFIANSRNLGIEMAKGEFVAFIDSDDVWHREKLERQLPLFAQPEVGIVYSRFNKINANGRVVGNNFRRRLFRGRIIEKLLLHSLSFANSSVVVRKSVLDRYNLRFRTERQGAEDRDLWLRVAEVADADYVDRKLLFYRVHDKCVSRDPHIMYKSSMTTLDDFEKHVLQDYPMDDPRRSNLLKACCFSRFVCEHIYASAQQGKGCFSRAFKMAAKAITIKPQNFVGWKLMGKTCVYSLQRILKREMINN